MPPVHHAQHKVPIGLKEKIEAKLDEIMEQGIITSVTEPPDLHHETQQQHLNVPRSKGPKQASHKETLQNTHTGRNQSPETIFSKADSFLSFYAIHLNKESSMKTTFNTMPGQ